MDDYHFDDDDDQEQLRRDILYQKSGQKYRDKRYGYSHSGEDQ